jgi:hypothetical protein
MTTEEHGERFMTTQALQAGDEDREWKYAKAALAWHGWGSPIGLGVFLVCLAATAALVRLAVLG